MCIIRLRALHRLATRVIARDTDIKTTKVLSSRGDEQTDEWQCMLPRGSKRISSLARLKCFRGHDQ